MPKHTKPSARCEINNIYGILTQKVCHAHRIIVAVGKHVIAQFALAGTYISISIEESAELRIVISALQIIEPQLFGCQYAIAVFFAVWSLMKSAL